MLIQSLCLSHSHTCKHRHKHTPCSLCWQAPQQLCLINGLICRPFCSVLFSFNKVLLCHCYRRRENMKKRRKLLRRSTTLTNHTSYCCVRAIIAREYMRASVCLRVKLVLLSSWGCFGSLAGASDGKLASDWHCHGFSRWPFAQKALSPFSPHFLSLLVKHAAASASQHLCVHVRVFLCFVCCLMILQLYNHLLFWVAAGFGYVPDSRVFFGGRVFNVGVLVRSQREVVPSMWRLFFVVFFLSGLICYVSQSPPLWSTSVVRAGDIPQGVKSRNPFKEMSENLRIIRSDQLDT